MTTNEVYRFKVKLEDGFTMLWGMDDLIGYLEQYGVVTIRNGNNDEGWLSVNAVDDNFPQNSSLRIYWIYWSESRLMHFHVFDKDINEQHRNNVVAAVRSYLKHKDGK